MDRADTMMTYMLTSRMMMSTYHRRLRARLGFCELN